MRSDWLHSGTGIALLREESLRAQEAQRAAQLGRDMANYIARIQAKVKGNIVLPLGIGGDPSAQFSVDQLPDGTVIDVQLKRSSGNSQLDQAIERAIRKSSPLPQPQNKDLFDRTLDLTFYPLRG